MFWPNMQSNRTLKPIHSPNYAVHLNPQTNAITKPRSPTQPSNQCNHQTTQSNSTIKPVHSPNHAVCYEDTLTQITHHSIHCHWIRKANHDLLHRSVTRVCSVSLLSESVTGSRERYHIMHCDVSVLQNCTFPGLSSCNGRLQYCHRYLDECAAILYQMLWSNINLSNCVYRMTRGGTDIAMSDILTAINTTWRRLLW